MKICNQCEAINADGAQFCCKCGAQLGASQHRGNHRDNYRSTLQHQQQQYQRQQYQQQQYQQQQYQQQQYQQQPYSYSIGFSDAVRICLKEKYASFEGRATRSEFWYYNLFCFLTLVATIFVGGIIGAIYSGGDIDTIAGMAFILYCIVALSLICPSISVLVRRLHDIGKSGWWYWIGLIPYIGGLAILVFCCIESEKRDNEYGPYIY